MNPELNTEIAITAARLVVEEGLEYGQAKTRALRTLGLPARTALPGNDELEDQVREYLALFHADTQPAELAALRALAADWMERLAEFRPHLTGAVWRGTATRLSNIFLQLYCDDSKSTEIALLNQGIDFDVDQARNAKGDTVDRLLIAAMCRPLNEMVTIALTILDYDDQRGALKPDARGRSERGDLNALRQLLKEQD
ncbi:MAG: hypothetical protein ABW220_13080 [Burkholderiaceae bacterium]